jgi:hypothetical protein
MALAHFAGTLGLTVDSLPVHGDPVIDNPAIPIEIRAVRKAVFDRIRAGELRAGGHGAQKKVEKSYRREFWQTDEGMRLEAELPNLPGHVRAIIPEIRTIGKNESEYLLLLELAKSANTRNLIGSVVTTGCDVEQRIAAIRSKTPDLGLAKRIDQALVRFGTEKRRRGLA